MEWKDYDESFEYDGGTFVIDYPTEDTKYYVCVDCGINIRATSMTKSCVVQMAKQMWDDLDPKYKGHVIAKINKQTKQ